MELQVNEREALLIVTALGTYQNRVGQHTSWDQRKRLTTLRGRLADCVIIGDEDDVVIDPCAGSGSALLAAANLQRRAYGFEIKKDFYAKAVKFIKTSQSPNLFV